MPKITVIVPVYRVEQYLRRCTDSILSQSFRDFELVLVDDGSPDQCPAMCDAIAAGDSRVHVIHQKNGGLSAARNSGIDWALACSESSYLCFVDSDDWVHPDYLKILLSTAEQTGCAISACGFLRTSGDPLPAVGEYDVECLSADDFYCGNSHGGLTAVAWNKLYHRSLFRELRYPVGKLHEDEFTTYRAVYAAGAVAVTEAPLYAYFVNPNGITGVTWSPRRMHSLEGFEEQIAFAQAEENPRLLEKAIKSYIYGAYDQLNHADPEYIGVLRGKLRSGLKLGAQAGAFDGRKNLWAYEAAYPCKPLWWLVSRLGKG